MMGYDKLRKGQDMVVYSMLRDQDTIALLPTSMGKTACYVIPTVIQQRRNLIFSPLIALMKDQVESLWKYKLRAAQVSSGQTPAENLAALSEWENGNLQFLLVAPERMQNDKFMEVMRKMPPDIVTIDEAHCLQGFSKISTEDGPIAIAELHRRFHAGEPVPRVLSAAADGGRSFKRITNSWQQPWRPLFNIITDDGSIRSTDNHVWHTQRGWVATKDLKPGEDSITSLAGGDRHVREPSGDQLQMLIGSFLGDGGLQCPGGFLPR